jgi:hypothetical protein
MKGDGRYWKELCRNPCLRKMLHFLWRFSHNSLALRMNLKCCGMKLAKMCVLCGGFNEDGGHSFFK